MEESIFETSVESTVGTAERASSPKVKRPKRREPLGFAFFGLMLFMVVYFARPEDWIPGLSAVPLAKIAGVLIFFALLLSVDNIRWNMPPEVTFLTLLVAQLWLAAVFSTVWRGGAVSVMLDFSKVLPLFLVIYLAVRSMKRLRSILFVQAVCVAVIAAVSVVNAHELAGRLQGALSGIYGNPNDLALIIDISLPLCLALALTSRQIWKKIAWTAAMLVMVYAVVLTASRAGTIAFGVAAIICLWHFGVKGRRFYLLLLVPAAAIVFWLYAGKTLEQRFQETNVSSTANSQEATAAASAEQRKALLIRSLQATAEHPLFGVGPDDFPIISGNWHVTHDSYTQVSAEGGIPAFLLYVLILGYAIVNLRNARRYRKSSKRLRLFSMALEASLAAYLVGSIFGSEAYQLFPYCLIASTSALRLIVQRDRAASIPLSAPQLTPNPVEATVWE